MAESPGETASPKRNPQRAAALQVLASACLCAERAAFATGSLQAVRDASFTIPVALAEQAQTSGRVHIMPGLFGTIELYAPGGRTLVRVRCQELRAAVEKQPAVDRPELGGPLHELAELALAFVSNDRANAMRLARRWRESVTGGAAAALGA